jgi:hypothetical protein
MRHHQFLKSLCFLYRIIVKAPDRPTARQRQPVVFDELQKPVTTLLHFDGFRQ